MNRSIKYLFLLPLGLLLAGTLPAKGPAGGASDSARYIVVLDQAPLAEWFSRGAAAGDARLESQRVGKPTEPTRRGRLDVHAPESRAYLAQLDREYEQLQSRARSYLGRELKAVHRYRNAVNGFATRLTRAEAERLRAMPGVKAVRPDEIYQLDTDAGPSWLGAGDIWSGQQGLPDSSGEGIIVGVIDSGINWEHNSFKDLGDGTGNKFIPYDHKNPLIVQLGLCSDEEVLCNDKLIGVWDFVTDDEDTNEVEENTNGWDNDGHGSHVASTAVGNTQSVSFRFGLTQISGVAPKANLISYRVCYIGGDGGCQNSAILAAIDQAITDGVDAINYSIGSQPFSPWLEGSSSMAFLNAYGAGIFVATSAGNGGPEASTLGAPANAPWISAVGNATHNRVFGNRLQNLTGGDAIPPVGLTGASWEGDSGIRDIVYAGDYGNALCGDFTDTAAVPSCESNSSASNPFAPGTFNGEIVVCDRGTYGRVEKGLNVKLAGAGGYILVNSEGFGNSVESDNHCLPATHLTQGDGEKLKDWLASGSGHSGEISDVGAVRSDSFGDVVNRSSSRGPAESPVQDVLKPNLIAPGTSILGAFAKEDDDANTYSLLGGTSMASPHVTGAAALLLSVDPTWTPGMINSALETTATTALAIDFDATAATPFKAGSGRPQLANAANAGLVLEETTDNFEAANPSLGGDPGALNLPGLADTQCRDSCRFTRTVTALADGKTWTASAEGFPEGVSVTTSPAEFTLAAGASQALEIEVNLSGAGQLGNWVYGRVLLSAENEPEQALTVAVFATGGELPPGWQITASTDSGNKTFFLSGLVALPDATITAGGLTREQRYTEDLPQDPTEDDPYDSPTGTFTVLQEVPEGSMWLHTETLASTALDLDLFVGLDSNGNGEAEEDEQLCSSTSSNDLELCDIYNPVPGTYWILVQNWHASNDAPDSATLQYALVGDTGELGLTATAPGITDTDETFPVQVAWNNVDAVSTEELLGAVGVGSDRDHPNNVGVIPVRFTRTAIKAATTTALMDGRTQRLALRNNYTHRYLFIDVPSGADSLSVTAHGADEAQNNALAIELHRIDFADAFDEAPLVPAAPVGTPVASGSGANGVGPEVMVSGASLMPGRWYVVLTNSGGSEASVEVLANVEFSDALLPVSPGLWQPASRPGINQGFDYALGAFRGMLWYTFDKAGLPAWYLAAGLEPDGNIWVADLMRFTNDGAEQQSTVVGQVAITTVSKDDVILTWQLFGLSGSDRMESLSSPNTCPDTGSGPESYTGIWFRGMDGLGGASVLLNAVAQGQVHYLFDANGEPRWLQGAIVNSSPTEQTYPLSQYSGFCPNCFGSSDSEEIGLLTMRFDSEGTGEWTLDYLMKAPLEGDVTRTENVIKLTETLNCES